jgi:hypothetical protein
LNGRLNIKQANLFLFYGHSQANAMEESEEMETDQLDPLYGKRKSWF